MSVQAPVRELDRLEGLWADGLSDAFHMYLESVGHFTVDVQPQLALAAALIEIGVRLQGLGGRAAPPTTLLIADNAPLAVQVAFARAIESVAAAAASEEPAPATRQLLQSALGASR